MKTASIPNDPNLESLIKVTAELTVVLEAYENECISSLNARAEAALDKAMVKLSDPSSPPNSAKILRDLVSEVMTEVATHIKIHERSLGLTAQQAPAENALRAIATWDATTKLYWDSVSG